jgi:hypothetical protein
MKILIPNKITLSRYNSIKQKMLTLGAPVIQCIQLSNDCYYALEGSHRVTAAKELNLIPILNIITKINNDNLDNSDTELKTIIRIAKQRQQKKLIVEFP